MKTAPMKLQQLLLLGVQIETKLVLFLPRTSLETNQVQLKITEYFHNNNLDGQKCEVPLVGSTS